MDDLDNLPDPGALGRGREVTGQLESGRLVGSPQIESGHLKLRDSSSETGIEDGLVRGDRGKCGEWWVGVFVLRIGTFCVKPCIVKHC